MQKLSTALLCLGIALLLSTGGFAQQSSTGATKPQTPSGSSATGSNPQSSSLATDKEKASYALGMNIGQQMKNDALDIDPNLVSQGLKDALSGSKTLMTEAEAQAAFAKFRTELMARKQSQMQQAGESNKKAGDQFLAANKTKEGVVALPDGLQYKILKEGTGPKPKASDTVEVNYRGTLLDGTEFDSSYKRNHPETLGVGQVIKGWTEALQLMPVGSKWQLFIPPDLAYGANGAGNAIAPNSTLIFEVELLSIKPPQQQPN
jgi:FKBP-type peptidyl-prolyl cis-trans isomerase FklB